MWGSAPRPSRGQVPCTPLLGLRPKDSSVCGLFSALALSSHLGLRPKPRARSLAANLLILENEAPEKGQYPPTPHGFFGITKGCGAHTRRGPTFRRIFVSCSTPRNSRGVLGRSPKWERKVKARITHQTHDSLGRSPNKGVQGDYPPAGVWGGAPPRPPTPHKGFR